MPKGKATTDKNRHAENRQGLPLHDIVKYLAPLAERERKGTALLKRLLSEPATRKRIDALRERARNRLRAGLSGRLHSLFEQSPLRLLASKLNWREFLPPFRDHAARLFDIRAKCLLTAAEDEEEYGGALNLLPPMIHGEIAPWGSVGDWEDCLTTAWRRFTTFEHTIYDDGVQAEIIEALREHAPERNPNTGAFSKAILEVLWQRVDEWKARFHSPDTESQRPPRREIPAPLPAHAQSPSGSRRGGTRGPEVCNGPHFLDTKKPFLRWWAALKMKESQCPERVRVTPPA